jgi:all-trans-retinol 13,14-reductase
MNDKENFDVIIIGAGLGGLTTGAVLSRNNLKVLIVEMHDKAGGFATNFKRKDYTFDVSLHNFGPLNDNFLIRKIFNELDIFDKFEFIQYENYQRLIFPNNDFIIDKEGSKFIQNLKKLFPFEKNGIESIFEEMTELKKEFDEIENLDIFIDKLEEEFPTLPIKFPSLVKYVYTTFGQLIDKYISDEKLKGILGSFWWIYGIPPEKVAAILYSVPSMNYLNFSGGYIKGTSQKLSDILSVIINENNGEVKLNTKVEKIVFENNKLSGIITDKNEKINAKIVISNISPFETFNNLINENKIEKRYLKKINKLQLSLSCIQLYIGLDCNSKKLGFNNHNITIFSSYNQCDNYIAALNGDYDKIFLSATDYSDYDDELVKKNKGMISVMSLDSIKNWENLSKEKYDEKKTSVINILLNRLEQIMPDLKKHIEIAELATPMTIKRYTGHPEGSIYGISQTIEQSGINRLNPETIFENLYLCGANIYPGAGFSSVISSGYKVAKKIIKDFS